MAPTPPPSAQLVSCLQWGEPEKNLSEELLQHARQVSRQREGAKRGFFSAGSTSFDKLFLFSWKHSHFSLPCPSGPFNSLSLCGRASTFQFHSFTRPVILSFFPPLTVWGKGVDWLLACWQLDTALDCPVLPVWSSRYQPGCIYVQLR